jgi:hypothetical protein
MNPAEMAILDSIRGRLEMLRELIEHEDTITSRKARLQKEYKTAFQQYLTAYGNFTGNNQAPADTGALTKAAKAAWKTTGIEEMFAEFERALAEKEQA